MWSLLLFKSCCSSNCPNWNSWIEGETFYFSFAAIWQLSAAKSTISAGWHSINAGCYRGKHFSVTTFTIRWFCVQMLTSVENMHYTHLQFATWGMWGCCCWKLFKLNTHTHTGVNAHESEGTKSRWVNNALWKYTHAHELAHTYSWPHTLHWANTHAGNTCRRTACPRHRFVMSCALIT